MCKWLKIQNTPYNATFMCTATIQSVLVLATSLTFYPMPVKGLSSQMSDLSSHLVADSQKNFPFLLHGSPFKANENQTTIEWTLDGYRTDIARMMNRSRAERFVLFHSIFRTYVCTYGFFIFQLAPIRWHVKSVSTYVHTVRT